jgi:hypothetical protein
MAKVLEQSRFEAEIAAKELKTLSSTPAIVCDVHGNMHASSAALTFERPPSPT